MGEIITKTDVKFLKALCLKYNIAAVILFGSSATKRTNPMSDMDIAYLPRRQLSLKKEPRLYLDIIGHFKRDDIDLVDLSNAGLLLKYSVITSGTVLVCTSERLLYNFIVDTRRDYLDTAYLRSIFSHYLTKRIKLGLFGEAK